MTGEGEDAAFHVGDVVLVGRSKHLFRIHRIRDERAYVERVDGAKSGCVSASFEFMRRVPPPEPGTEWHP